MAKQTEENNKKFGCVYIDRYKNLFYYHIYTYFNSSGVVIDSIHYQNIPYGYAGSLYFYNELSITNHGYYQHAIMYVPYTNAGTATLNTGIVIDDPRYLLANMELYVGALKE